MARMNQFPNQGFRDSFGKLFCGACSTVLHNCKSMIAAHLETKKHKANLIKLQSRSAGDIEIMSGLSATWVSTSTWTSLASSSQPSSSSSTQALAPRPSGQR